MRIDEIRHRGQKSGFYMLFGFLSYTSGKHVRVITLYTVDPTEYVTAQIDATFHEGRGKWRAIR